MFQKSFPLFIFASLIFYSASAQNDRSPNDAEKAAINKAVNIIVPLIDGFKNDTWQKEEGGADAPEDYSVQNHPDVSLGVAPFNDWHFTLKPGSDFYNKNIKPYYDKMNSGSLDANDTKAMAQFVKEGEKVKDLSNLYVEVHVNQIAIPVKPSKNNPADLKIQGCDFAYIQPKDKLIGTDHGTPASYVLVFGNWSTASARAAFGDYGFKFTHPHGSPFIENIAIIISGSNDRIKEFLKTTDWQKVNNGLTK